MANKVLNIIYWMFFGIMITSGFVVVLSIINSPRSVKFLTVQSGSMEPQIKSGSLIVVKKQNVYKPNDVITFEPINERSLTVTHRILDLEYMEGSLTQFVTKGDANEEADTEKVNFQSVLGRVIFTLPYFGYLISFIKTPIGTIIFVIIPAIIFVANEMIVVRAEIIKLKTKHRKRKR